MGQGRGWGVGKSPVIQNFLSPSIEHVLELQLSPKQQNILSAATNINLKKS